MHAALKEQIAGLERRLWLEGSEAFDKIMAPECFMVFPKPIGILTRQEILASLGNFARWDEVTIEGGPWQLPTENVVVFSYEAQAKRGEQPYAAFCSSTYVFIGQVWRIVLHQHTVGG